MFTPISFPLPSYTGIIEGRRSTRVCVVGVGMLPTHRMIDENRTTVIARIRIVPTTSETPDSSSRRTIFMSWPPGGRKDISRQPSRRYIKCSR